MVVTIFAKNIIQISLSYTSSLHFDFSAYFASFRFRPHDCIDEMKWHVNNMSYNAHDFEVET